MTASTATTVLALIATLSLVLSLFAIVRPVIANHEPPDGPEVIPTTETFPGGDPICPAGSVGFRFNNPTDGTQTVTFPGGATATITLDVNGNALTFVIDGALAVEVVLKATTTQNVYDYSGLGGVAHDDGLVSPATDSISHIDFCLVPIVADIEVTKDGPDLSKVGDPTDYTITIENTGNVELFIESVIDTLAGDLTADVVAECGPLAVDELCSFSYVYTPVGTDADPLLNTVNVTANSAADFSGAEATGSASASVELFQPSITVEKTAEPAEVEIGDDVSYTITITNTSSADSPDLVIDSISDTLAGSLIGECTSPMASGDSCVIDYTLVAEAAGEMCNTVTVQTHPDGFPNDVDGEDTACVTVIGPGSITINKEVECEECETRTPGFWFNTAGSHDDETNALLAELAAMDGGSNASAVEVNIDGTIFEFASAQDVRDFVAADTSGDLDGETGLSRDGALLRHYLSTWLNVVLNGEECDLLSRELDGQTVEEILAEAAAALEADDEDAEVEALEKLTTINESDDAEENPLTCGDTNGTSGDGFMFELFAEADFPDGDPIDSGTTGDDGAGTLIFEDLPLGTYVLVETGNANEQECEIVSVDGGVLNEDGTVTVEITEETPDVVLTIVNECEGGGGEENPGDITVIKETDEETPGEEFAFSASWDADGFVLIDGGSEFSGDLEAGEFTVTEALTEEQIAAGWSLVDIDCGEATVVVEGNLTSGTVTITLAAGESVVCTFTNEQGEEEELGGIEVLKVDAAGTPKSGATFELYLDDGDEVFDPEGTGGGGGGTTGCDGAANVAAGTATDIANAIVADAATLTGASFESVPGTGTPNGTAECLSWFATNGANFGILTTGDVNLADDANAAEDDGADLDGDNVRGDTDFDVTILKLDLTTPAGANCLRVDFSFYSEEFEEFVGSEFNDAFIAELNTSTWTTSGSTISAPNNFAFDPSNQVISINSTGATAMSLANADGTTYDGATVLLTAATPVGAGANSLYLSIFDQGDQIYDSAVFLDNVRFETVADVATECVAGAEEVSGGDELLDTKDTGVDGTALFTGLEPGTYWLHETQAPDGCEIIEETTMVELTEEMIIELAGDPLVVEIENDCDQGGEQPGGGGPNQPPREGTQGGNPVPDTALEPVPTASLPAILLAMLMLAGLGAAGYAVRAEARRRS